MKTIISHSHKIGEKLICRIGVASLANVGQSDGGTRPRSAFAAPGGVKISVSVVSDRRARWIGRPAAWRA